MTSSQLTGFISAPASADVPQLRRLIESLGVQVADALITTPEGDTLRKQIQSSDFVVVVIDQTDDPNVIYEAGIAAGLGKPIILVVDPDVERVLPFLQSRLHIRTQIKDSEILRIALSRFVASLERKRSHPASSRQSKPRKTQTRAPQRLRRKIAETALQEKLSKVQHLRQSGDPREVEQFVADALTLAGVTMVMNPYTAHDRGVDFAVSSGELDSTFGGQLFIEVKSGNLTNEQLESAEEQLLRYLTKAGARAALLLYLDRNNRRFERQSRSSYLVLRFDMEDFVRELAFKSFEEIVFEARSRIAHGLHS